MDGPFGFQPGRISFAYPCALSHSVTALSRLLDFSGAVSIPTALEFRFMLTRPSGEFIRSPDSQASADCSRVWNASRAPQEKQLSPVHVEADFVREKSNCFAEIQHLV